MPRENRTLPDARPRPHLRLTLCLLAFAQLIIALDYNIVFVALPVIGEGLSFSTHTLQWVVSAYAVAFGGFLLLGGRASDLFGRRRMFVLGMLLYGAGSMLGGLATEPELLIAARAIQGLGGAFLAPATLSLVSTTFAEGAERNKALAVWGGAGGTGMVLGSLLGGVLTVAFGWESVFFVNLLLAAVGVALAFVLIPKDGKATESRTFDLVGAVTATAGATLLVFALVQGPQVGWLSRTTLVSLAVAAVLLLVFLATEHRLADPLMPLRLFTNRNLSAGTGVCFLFMATFGALAYFLTLYFQDVQGYSALRTGFAFAGPCVAVLGGTVLGARMATALGIRTTLLSSLVIGGVGMVLLGLVLSADATYVEIAFPLLVLSVAQGVVFTAMYAAATTGVQGEDQGIASGIATTGQQVGGAVGLAVLVAVAASATADAGPGAGATTQGIQVAVYVTAAGIALTALLALVFRGTGAAPAGPVPVDLRSVDAPAPSGIEA